MTFDALRWANLAQEQRPRDPPSPEVNNSALKVLVAKMSDHGLSPKTITGNYVPVVKMVVASAVDEQGEQIYPPLCLVGSA